MVGSCREQARRDTHESASILCARRVLTRLRRLRLFIRKLYHPIGRNDLVVDIGSGGDPHPRADVIVDRAVFEPGQRTAEFCLSAPTVIADIHAMPFRSEAFGYSICSHILEHVDDPGTAAREMFRISAAGYIETTSDRHERMWPMGWHQWMVSDIGSGLVFVAKTSPFLGRNSSEPSRPNPAFVAHVHSHTSRFFVQHHWEGCLHVRTVGRPGCLVKALHGGMGDAPPSSPLKRKVYSVVSATR
jgi:hypothetical protein